MEHTTNVIDDDYAEFSLPPELLTDDDFIVEKAWGSTRCGARGRQNHNCRMQVSSQTAAATEDPALMNINGYNNNNNHNGRGLLDLPRKHLIPNDGSRYYNRRSIHYQKLQAIHQLKQQQQLVKRHRQAQLVQQRSRGLGVNENSKIAGSVDLLPSSAWSTQQQGSDVFLENRTGKRGSTGTGVFLPRCVNHATTAEVREEPMVATGLVPATVVQPSVRSSSSLNDGSWSNNDGGFSSQMIMEQQAKEPLSLLPLDWAY